MNSRRQSPEAEANVMRHVAMKPLAVDMATVEALTSLSESNIEAQVREGTFPKPRQLSPRRVGWLYREIEEWLESRPVSDLLPPPNTGAPKKKPAAGAAA